MASSVKVLLVLHVLFFCVVICHDFKWQIREPIDLTWPVDENSIHWPGTNAFMYTKKTIGYNENSNWYASNDFCISQHGGTHLDAPYHFYKYGWKVSDIPIQKLLTYAVVVDMSEIVKRLGPTVELQEADLEDWERIYGPMPSHCVVLVRFGWSEYYHSRDAYLGVNGTHMIFPGIAPDAARWFVNSKKIVGVGVDTASVDGGLTTTFETHRILAEHNIYQIENVNIPKKLPARGFNLLVLPTKLKDGSGAPSRIMAIPEVVLTTDPDTTKLHFSVNSVPWYGHTSVVLASLLLLGMYTINCFTL